MSIGIKGYMALEEYDPTLPSEFFLPCASDTDEEITKRAAVRRRTRPDGDRDPLVPQEDQ